MKIKTKHLRWIPSLGVALVITIGAVMKLAGSAQIVEVYSKIGLLPYMRIFGLAELLFTGLFLFHRSMNIGFLLLTGYFGGAMAVELSNGKFFIFPAIILSVVWIAAFLRDANIFWVREKLSAEDRKLTV
jgi:hypothetical protein